MTLKDLSKVCAPHHLAIMGAVHDSDETIVLLGPLEPGFWDHLRAQPEMHDGGANPLDRWSKRAIGQVAQNMNARSIFPSDGPPYAPFISWALASGRCFLSPAGLLVHDDAGLMVSFRGALGIKGALDIPPPPVSPCLTCDGQPCTVACPVDALKPDSYDVPACQTHIKGPDQAGCKTHGCAARRACPISQSYPRETAQSAFHMRAFLGE